jgi:chorismate dehydratase
MDVIRIGAVSFLNSRPLVRGLERWPDRFSIRYDLPRVCADLLHQGAIDVGLVPSIEYLKGDAYRAVPDAAVVSDGPVRSVALFTGVPIERIRTIALDTSSRTSVALLRVLCVRHFGIGPRFVEHRPDIDAMLGVADAALLIGDPALLVEHALKGLQKIDLGAEWRALTGLPFVYAFWTGRPGVLTTADVIVMQQARADGEADPDGVARLFFDGDPVAQRIGGEYLRENIRFRMGERELAGLERFYELAAEVGASGPAKRVEFY